jgi:hypothetical protein
MRTTPEESDIAFTRLAQRRFVKPKKLWKKLGLCYTPKFRAYLTHALAGWLAQMRRLNGFGEKYLKITLRRAIRTGTSK